LTDMDQPAEYRIKDSPPSIALNSGRSGPSAPRPEHVERMLLHLRRKGEQRDIEIAAALGLPLELVRSEIEALAAAGEVTTCRVTRFEDSRKIECISCRLSGTVPITVPVARSPLDREAGAQ